MSIGAITFDLWDCLIQDDSDEPKRAAAGKPPKMVARRDLAYEILSREAPIDRPLLDAAYAVCTAAFNKVWHEQHVTWTVADRMQILLKGLDRTLPDDAFAELVRLHEDMELEFRPDPAPHALEALEALHGKYPLAVISDAIFSPGRALRELLQGFGMLHFFDEFVFSDELGRSKPDPAVFKSVAQAFNVPVKSLVHIGDRPHNDIGGPHAVGARGVLLTAVKQRDLGGHVPDAVCNDFRDLPRIIESLNAV